MLNYQAIKDWDFGSIVQAYTARDSILYALGIGMGSNPMDENELKFVLETSLLGCPNDGDGARRARLSSTSSRT